MASPAGPIYASTLHRRDRAWGGSRRRARLRLRLALLGGGAVGAGALAILSRIG